MKVHAVIATDQPRWPKLTAPQWEQVRRLISELESLAAGEAPPEEKRGSARSAASFPIRITGHDDASHRPFAWGVARNLSCSGLSVVVRRMFHVGDAVTVHLPTPDGAGRPLVACVVRCRYVGELYHEIGLGFTASA